MHSFKPFIILCIFNVVLVNVGSSSVEVGNCVMFWVAHTLGAWWPKFHVHGFPLAHCPNFTHLSPFVPFVKGVVSVLSCQFRWSEMLLSSVLSCYSACHLELWQWEAKRKRWMTYGIYSMKVNIYAYILSSSQNLSLISFMPLGLLHILSEATRKFGHF